MRDYETPGAKFYEWELKGVPVRIEIGPRDVAANACIVVNRVTGTKETIAFDALVETVAIMLDDIHHRLFRALKNAYVRNGTRAIYCQSSLTSWKTRAAGIRQAGAPKNLVKHN